MSNTDPLNPKIAGRLPKRLVIVGSNESAWMAAAGLAAFSKTLGCRITVLSTSEPVSEFPGESTLPSIHGMLSNLQMDEHVMMRACQATYQVATQFSDWVQIERDAWRTLGPTAHPKEPVSLFSAWFSERHHGRLLRPYHSYSLHWGAALAGKAPYGFGGPSEISRSGTYAFHIEGQKFAEWLRSVALAADAEEIRGRISKVATNGRGGVAQIKLESGTTVAGDFFIDCTGVDSLLLGKELKTPFVSAEPSAFGDRILTVRLPSRRQIPPYTRITGLENGWSWQSPLATSFDAGFVFDSTLISDDAAWLQFQELLTLDGIAGLETLTPVFTSFASGRRLSFWKDNVLALGTAACRIDPIANAGRHLTQIAIEAFIERFPERNVHQATIEQYNSRMVTAVDECQDFARLHYHVSRRTDSAFWQNVSLSSVPATIQRRLALYEAAGTVGDVCPEAIPEIAWLTLLAGSGRLPSQPSVHARTLDPAGVQQSLRDLLKANEAALKELPLHEELLDWIHANGSGLLKSA